MLVVPDVSEFQVGLTAAYARDAIIFRVCDGSGYQDHKFLHNASEVKALYDARRIKAAIGYQVYRPVNVAAQYNFFWKLMGPTRPPWLKGVMLDAETWGGEIRGNHSAQLNALAGMHAHRMGWAGVLGYGNQGDLASLWPQRDKRLRLVVANYDSALITGKIRNAIGQQYTDGSARWAIPKGLTRVTVPFGRCDHNVFPRLANGAALAATLQPPPVPVKPPPVKPPPPKPPTPTPTAVVLKAGTVVTLAHDTEITHA